MDEIASVIILSYENFNLIYETIDSVIYQTYENIEILVADDGSNNFPEDEICKYIMSHRLLNIVNVNVYSNEKNLGTVKNLNTAIKKSTGKYIIPLASDDVFTNSKVLSEIVAKLNTSQTGMICCRRILCDEMMTPIRYMPTIFHHKKIKSLDTAMKQHKAFARGEFYEMASGSATYYLRETLYSDGLFNEDYRLLEDWPHYLEVTNKHIIETAYDIVSIKYRCGGISGKASPIIIADYVKMMEKEIAENIHKYNLLMVRYLRFRLEVFLNKRKLFVYLNRKFYNQD